MNEQLLLRLPHRQFVFTLPKVLRVLFRHDKSLRGEISRLIERLVRDFSIAAAGTLLRAVAVVVFQSAGALSRQCSDPPWGWNPPWHSLVLEGGFDRDSGFLHVPKVDLAEMSACFRQRVNAFFLERNVLNGRLAPNIIEWEHSGFSVDGSVHVAAGSGKAREALEAYLQRHVLVVAEVGYLTYGPDAVDVLFHVVNERHVGRRPIIFTTN